MQKIKDLIRFLLILILSNLSLTARSQITERTNRVISLPDIPGYKTLKCDFHMPFNIQASANFDIERYPFGQVTLAAHDTTTITLKALWKYPESTPLRMQVLNLITSPDEVYQTVFNLPTLDKLN